MENRKRHNNNNDDDDDADTKKNYRIKQQQFVSQGKIRILRAVDTRQQQEQHLWANEQTIRKEVEDRGEKEKERIKKERTMIETRIQSSSAHTAHTHNAVLIVTRKFIYFNSV